MEIARQAWLYVASSPSNATRPRVTPWPYIAISNVPGRDILAAEFFTPAVVIFSSESVIRLFRTSPVFIQGIDPLAQNLGTPRSGVPPEFNTAT